MGTARHGIDQAVLVYLNWGEGGWEIDFRMFDGQQLDTADGTDRADNSNCWCDEGDREECETWTRQATDTGFPTGVELAEMLAEAAEAHQYRSTFDSGLTVEDFAVGDKVRVESRGGVVGVVREIVNPKGDGDARPQLAIHPCGYDSWERFWNLPSQCVKIESTEEG